MRLWFSGEVHADIYDAYDAATKEIEATVKRAIGTKKYGTGLKSWDVIPIIVPKSTRSFFPEIAKYSAKIRECEFRLYVDHAKFKKGDAAIRRELICDLLRRTLDYLESWQIPNFDIEGLRADFEAAVRSDAE